MLSQAVSYTRVSMYIFKYEFKTFKDFLRMREHHNNDAFPHCSDGMIYS